MELRHVFLIIAIFTMGIIGVPSVYSLFSGMHNWYDTGISDDPFDQYTIPCQKCHADVQLELDSSSIHQTFRCINCHVNTSSNGSHINFIAPRCLDCHATGRQVIDSKGNTLIAPIADVFGENVTNITSKEVHRPFVDGARSSLLMNGENEACTTCHTKKSLKISWSYYDTYKFQANRLTSSTWEVSNFSKTTQPGLSPSIQANESVGKHSFTSKAQLKFGCEKCHSNIRAELNNSRHHTNFGCFSCHQLYSTFHAASIPPCLDCHGNPPRQVTDLNGSIFTAPPAPLYSGTISGPEPHIPFVLSANNSAISTDKNAACASCHSTFNNNITFTRPGFIEWDVVDSSGNWVIQNITFGQTKEIKVSKSFDGKVHNIPDVKDVSCVSCHQDIRQAVLSGGHSFEQWRKKHDPNNSVYRNNINDYCKGCHKPVTQNGFGISPYPAYPFNSQIHNAVIIACMDCHGKPDDFYVNINGGMRRPPFNAGKMGNIQNSINQQPAFVRSYLCVGCKNAGLPVPGSGKPLHFKLITEPEIIVYVDGQQKYP